MLATNKGRQSIKGKGPKNPQNLLNILYIHPCSKSTPQIPNGIPILNSFFSLFSSFVFFPNFFPGEHTIARASSCTLPSEPTGELAWHPRALEPVCKPLQAPTSKFAHRLALRTL